MGCPAVLGLTLPSSTVKTRTKDKYRVVYTDHQRLELEKEFHYSRYITIRRKAELAATLGLSERQVGTLQGPITAWEGPVGRVRIQARGSTSFCGQIKARGSKDK